MMIFHFTQKQQFLVNHFTILINIYLWSLPNWSPVECYFIWYVELESSTVEQIFYFGWHNSEILLCCVLCFYLFDNALIAPNSLRMNLNPLFELFGSMEELVINPFSILDVGPHGLPSILEGFHLACCEFAIDNSEIIDQWIEVSKEGIVIEHKHIGPIVILGALSPHAKHIVACDHWTLNGIKYTIMIAAWVVNFPTWKGSRKVDMSRWCQCPHEKARNDPATNPVNFPFVFCEAIQAMASAYSLVKPDSTYYYGCAT